MENYVEINYEKNMAMLERAYSFSCKTRNHYELISVISGTDDLEKQLCLIELDGVYNQEEADILVNNLTNHPGPVRETCSFKISELIKSPKFMHFFLSRELSSVFINAITDINPSVSRNTVEIIKYLDNTDYLYNEIISKIKITLDELEKIEINRSYERNKKIFALYWYLEALSAIADKISENDDLIEILKITSESNEYTIREKTSKIISTIKTDNKKIKTLKNLLINDSNIYVRKHLSGYEK